MTLLKEMEPRNVLQLSLRRAGSTTMYRALTAHPDVSGASEFLSFHTRNNEQNPRLFDPSDPLSPINFSSAADFDPVYFHKKMRQNPVETWSLKHILSFFSDNPSGNNTVHYGKETFANLQLGFMLQVLPSDLYVIYLKRDLRGIASSYKEKGLFEKWHIRETFKQMKKTIQAQPDLYDRYAGLFDVDEDTADWQEVLTRKLILLQSELERHLSGKDHVKVVEFEGFLRNARTDIGEIFRWIGIPVTEQLQQHAHDLTSVEITGSSLMHPLYQYRHEAEWASFLTDEEDETIEGICFRFGINLAKVDVQQARKEIAEMKKRTPYLFIVKKGQNKTIEISKVPVTREELMEDIKKNLMPVPLDDSIIYLNKFPTTNAEFEVFLTFLARQNIIHDKNRFLVYHPIRGQIKRESSGNWKIKSGYENHPAVSMTWLGAYLYAYWIGAKLPDYSEWMAGYEGSQASADANTNQQFGGTVPVGSLPPNSLGLFDMLGNVSEFTDTFTTDESVAIPGGSWEDSPIMLESHRDKTVVATLPDKNIGFRIASEFKNLQPPDEEEAARKIRLVIDFLQSEQAAILPLTDTYGHIRSILANP